MSGRTSDEPVIAAVDDEQRPITIADPEQRHVLAPSVERLARLLAYTHPLIRIRPRDDVGERERVERAGREDE